MDYLNLISVPAIASIVYWIIELIKYTTKNSETFKRLIPLTAGIIGAILGVVAFYVFPSIIPATNVVVALLIGASSGLTSVGFNQIIKQATKGDEDGKGTN